MLGPTSTLCYKHCPRLNKGCKGYIFIFVSMERFLKANYPVEIKRFHHKVQTFVISIP